MNKFEVYSTNLGLFVKGVSGYPKRRLNGIPTDQFQTIDTPANAWSRTSWLFLEGIEQIVSCECLKAGANVLTDFTLKIPTIANDEIPLSLTIEEVGQYYDDEGDSCWRSYSDYQALYTPVYTKSEDEWVAEEFEVKVIRSLQVESYERPDTMVVKQCVEGNYGKNETRTIDLASIVTYEDIERLLTPEFLLHERPCTLSSSQMYSIVRRHIKDNIDSKYATITSDYDFCFTVKRKVAVKPLVSKTEIKTARGRSYAQPKFKTQTVTHREVELFEMTHTGHAYKGYTVMNDYSATSLKEMASFIQSYLDALMAEINKSVQECPHCSGTGHVVDSKINTNERFV